MFSGDGSPVPACFALHPASTATLSICPCALSRARKGTSSYGSYSVAVFPSSIITPLNVAVVGVSNAVPLPFATKTTLIPSDGVVNAVCKFGVLALTDAMLPLPEDALASCIAT